MLLYLHHDLLKFVHLTQLVSHGILHSPAGAAQPWLVADGDVLVDGEDAEPVGLVKLLLRVCAPVEVLLATSVLLDCLKLS